MDRVSLFQEYRLIERSESDINGAWKGAHLLLFFMAFVFGSFCTFCFHMLMYLFDEKCVLFPKLQSLTSLRHNVIYEFIPVEKEAADMLPVDFLSSQWVEKSTCYLPTYVPLLSGIFGLVWTTMFLMCSTGSRTLTGLQRPWRVLPPVFIFSLAMGGLCIYSSTVTHSGLQELCNKLGEITGSESCTYTVNVATLVYERRIRGVYQAIRLTIMSAWLHTMCWLLSAALASIRVLLAVDFQLVCVQVDLIGNIDKMLENNETQIRTVSPDVWYNNESASCDSLHLPVQRSPSKVHFNDAHTVTTVDKNEDPLKLDLLYLSKQRPHTSDHALVPTEKNRLDRLEASQKYPKEHQFIAKMVYDMLLNLDLPVSSSIESEGDTLSPIITRQHAQERIYNSKETDFSSHSTGNEKSSPHLDQDKEQQLLRFLNEEISELLYDLMRRIAASEPLKPKEDHDTGTNLHTGENVQDTAHNDYVAGPSKTKQAKKDTSSKKSNLKNASMQTEKSKRVTSQKVHIEEPAEDAAVETILETEKETQTPQKKEKQD